MPHKLKHTFSYTLPLPLLFIGALLALLMIRPGMLASRSQLGPAIINLNPKTTYQTFNDWEATDYNGNVGFPEIGIYGFNPPVMNLYKDQLADLAVNDLGINRVRLEIYSGDENTADYYSPFVTGQASFDEWKAHRQKPINDNNDPNVINQNGFYFAFLDHKVDTAVLPLKQQLEAKGERLYINLNYVDFDSSPFEHKDNPAEYAEFILATFQHLQSKYGWVPDGLEVVLEPNNSNWSPTQVGNALVAAANRLKANGYTPDFIAPSHAFLGIEFFDEMVQQVPTVLEHLTEFSYHCYNNCTDDANLRAVGERGTRYGIRTSQLEHIGHTYLDLHRDLKLANVSAWAQYTLAGFFTGNSPNDDGSTYFWTDINNLDHPIVSMAQRTKFLRQYMKFIKRGALRIQADTTDNGFDPVAFINADGKYVVVVKASGAGAFSVRDLPGGAYGIKYTTDQHCNGVDPLAYDINLPDVAINTGESLNTSIPACGVITVYAKTIAQPQPTPVQPTPVQPTPVQPTPVQPTPPASASISGPTVSKKNIAQAFTATVSPNGATMPLIFRWQASHQAAVEHSSGLSDTISFTWSITGVQTVTVTAANAGGTVTDTHVVAISPEAGVLQFSAANYSVGEGDTNASDGRPRTSDANRVATLLACADGQAAQKQGDVDVTVKRSAGTTGDITVAYATHDGTATVDQDYLSASGILTFANGVESQDFTVPILADRLVEGNESIGLTLTDPTGGAILGIPYTATLVILDDDGYFNHLPLILHNP
ncbi:hypothetical protein BH10CHL1_BH10CHL1_40060 [soil metagenome]